MMHSNSDCIKHSCAYGAHNYITPAVSRAYQVAVNRTNQPLCNGLVTPAVSRPPLRKMAMQAIPAQGTNPW